MISDKKIDEIITAAKLLANNYENLIQQSFRVHNQSTEVAVAALVMGMVQNLYLNSVPGEAIETLDTSKEIIRKVLELASEKIPKWDADRVKRVVGNPEETTNKMLKVVFKDWKDVPIEDEDKLKRKAGDSLN